MQRRPAVSRAPGGLRVATHNAHGLRTRAAAQLRYAEWAASGADVVFVQETWVGAAGAHDSTAGHLQLWLHEAAAQHHLPSPSVFTSPATGPRSGGMACVVMRPGLVSAKPRPLPAPDPSRLQALTLEWGNQKLVVLNTHWPNTPAEQRDFLLSSLSPALRRCPTGGGDMVHPVVVLGDFNLAPAPALDRSALPNGEVMSAGRAAEQRVAAEVAALLAAHQQQGDAYRHLHPRRRFFTRADPGGRSAARIDHIYLPPSLLQRLIDVRAHPSSSDHFILAADFAPLQASAPPRAPPWRAPAWLLTQPGVDQALLPDLQAISVVGMAMAPEQLLTHWGSLKQAITHRIQQQQRLQAGSQRAAAQPVAAAEEALNTAIAALHASPSPFPAAELQAVATARRHYEAACRPPASAAAALAAATWHHANEQPGTHLTSILRPPRSPPITCLRAAGGGLLRHPARMSQLLVRHFAGVSRAAPVDALAQEEVLAAMRQQQLAGEAGRVPAAAAAVAGAPLVSPQEVQRAHAALPPDSAPGPDGLPARAWGLGEGCLFPLLARLFSAAIQLNRLPRLFNRGAVTPIPKPGAPDASCPAAYRPITLLNSDYKLPAHH